MKARFNPAVFVLIRFAMVAPFSKAFLDRSVAKTWLEKRIPIFRDVCLPGLEIQTRKPDCVLAGLVEGLEDEAETILGLAGDALDMRVVFQQSAPESIQPIMATFRQGMAGMVDSDVTHVITIRIDNDDALHKDYVRTVVDHFRRKFEKGLLGDDMFASTIFGSQTNGVEFSTYLYPNGPFQARIETLGGNRTIAGIKGVYAINHTKVFDTENASMLVSQSPLWIQFIHGDNVSNSIKNGSIRLPDPDAFLADFGLTRTSFTS